MLIETSPPSSLPALNRQFYEDVTDIRGPELQGEVGQQVRTVFLGAQGAERGV